MVNLPSPRVRSRVAAPLSGWVSYLGARQRCSVRVHDPCPALTVRGAGKGRAGTTIPTGSDLMIFPTTTPDYRNFNNIRMVLQSGLRNIS